MTVLQPDLSEIKALDVKVALNSTNSSGAQEIDFFQDMEPVISKTPIHHIEVAPIMPTSSHSKFDLIESGPVDGWGDDLDAWEDVESETNTIVPSVVCS